MIYQNRLNKLSDKKRAEIINAGFEVFGQYGFKKGNTQEIAQKANISKGLLFYYFKNKESYYLYLCEFCNDLMLNSVLESNMYDYEDFFERIQYVSNIKTQIISDYPYIADFAMTLLKTKLSEEDSQVKQYLLENDEAVFDIYFKGVAFEKFNQHSNPKQIYKMIVWMGTGYLQECLLTQKYIDTEKVFTEMSQWCDVLKKASYRKEFL